MIAPAKTNPPLKWHGGKNYLARRIVEMMPPHLAYCEPFAGGLAVLLAKEPNGVSEVVNDVYGDLTNFWRVLQGDESFARFSRVVQAVPFSEAEYGDAVRGLEGEETDPVQRAAWFFVACRMSLAGRMDTFAPISRNRTRRGMNEQASAWLTAVDGLPAVHARLRRVAIFNRDALDVIRQQDAPTTLFYLDPPYLHETRVAPDAYRHEMTVGQHRQLLELLVKVQGKVILSGYPSALYDDMLVGWSRHEIDIASHAAGGRKKAREVEVLWCNF